MQLLFVGIRPDDAEPVLDALRQVGVVARPSYAENNAAIPVVASHVKEVDVAMVAMRNEAVDFRHATSLLAQHLPGCIALAWDMDVRSDWLAQAYDAGAWALALGSHPAQAAKVVMLAFQAREEGVLLRKAQQAAQEVQHRETSLLAAARDPVAYVHEGMHIRANQAYLDFFAITDPEDIEGLPLLDLISAEQAQEAKAMLRAASSGQELAEVEMHMQTADGEPRHARLTMTRSVYEGEHCLQVALRPVAEALPPVAEPAPAAAPEVQAEPDSPTPTAAFLALADRVSSIRGEDAQGHILAICSITDQQALDDMGLALAGPVMDSLLARLVEQANNVELYLLPGNVLGLVAKGVMAEEARSWLGDLRDRVALHPLEVNGKSLRPLLSMGAVMLGPDWRELGKDPLEYAEGLWRESRKSRKLEWFDPAARDREEERRQQEIYSHVRESVQKGSVSMSYRPILPLVGAEDELFDVLPGVQLPDGKSIANDELVSICENIGIAPLAARAAMAKASEAFVDASRGGRAVGMILSLSPSTMRDTSFHEDLVGILAARNISPDRVTIQVSEELARAWMGDAKRVSQQFQASGMRFMLANFSGSPESMDLLSELSVKWIRASEEWVEDLSRNDARQAKFKKMVEELNAKKVSTVADGVKDSATMTILFSSQVAYAGGDFLAAEAPDMAPVQ